MNEGATERPSATSSLPSGEGQGGVRRESAVLSPSPEHSRTWGRPDATTTIEAARALRRRMTPQEAKIWFRLRALRPQGFHFRRQVPIANFIVDFACLRGGLVVEIDGGQHGLAANLERDRARDETLAASGFRVLRFWNAEVYADPDAVVDTVFASLTEAASRLTPPQPSPEGREAVPA